MSTVPYELLVRWDQDGALQGAHARWRYVTRDDTSGDVIAESVGPAEPITPDVTTGTPFADLLDAALAAALGEIAALRSERAGMIAQIEALGGLAPPPPPTTLEGRREAVVARIETLKAERLTAGAAYAGKLFAMDDTSRTDLAGMATTAALVLAGALPWPADYATGWIALDNTRLSLPIPADGIALAAAVARCYAATVQHARDLKDAVLEASEPEAVDIGAGWVHM